MSKVFITLSFLMGVVVLSSNYLVQFPVKYYGLHSLIFGIGLLGGAGTMGMKSGIAHNTFGDLLLMGGILYVSAFLLLYFKVQYYLYKNRISELCKILFLCNIIFFVKHYR